MENEAFHLDSVRIDWRGERNPPNEDNESVYMDLAMSLLMLRNPTKLLIRFSSYPSHVCCCHITAIIVT